MILHLLTDDKFSDYVIEQFSGVAMCSEFVLMSSSEKTEYFKKTKDVKIVNPFQKDSMNDLIHSLGNYSAVVLHGLFFPWCETVLRNVPESVKVAWVFWGGEIYGRKDLRNTFLSKQSQGLRLLHEIKKLLKGKIGNNKYELPLELFHRIDYCLTDIHEDFEFVTSYTHSNMKEVWYNYYSIDETIGELRNQCVEGNNILIGNSCSLECNHIEGFKTARKIHDDNLDIVVPLSYGEPWLRQLLLKRGKHMFGDRFHPLVEFMPRDDYNKILKSCATVIMPHYRPQAFGNILTALWLGARVYMSEKSHLYAFFKRIGVAIFAIESDIIHAKHPKSLALSVSEREENRRIIASLYEKSVMEDGIRELIQILDPKISI